MAKAGKVLFLSIFSALTCFASSPKWITKDNSFSKENMGRVVEVIPAENADLVVIDTGLRSNLRIGAVCSVDCPENKTAKVVVVEANRQKSVALVITNNEIPQGAAVYITAN